MPQSTYASPILRNAVLALALLAGTSACTFRGVYRQAHGPVVVEEVEPSPAPPSAPVVPYVEPQPEPEPEPVPPAAPAAEPRKVVIEAGPIWSNVDAQTKCPRTCGQLAWEGVWWTTVWGQMSVCECLDHSL